VTDEDKTDSYESPEAVLPLVLAAIGTVLLVVVGALTFFAGLLSPLITDGCGGETAYVPGGPAYCRNSQVAAR
jgi:hypothetical protein